MQSTAHNFCLLVLAAGLLGCSKTVSEESGESFAPELDGGLTWINSEPLKLADLRGKVVLLDFFEYSCVNCIRTMPYLKEWQRRYRDPGLVIIGVHSPQYGFSMDPIHVNAGVRRLGLTYPVVVDSNLKIAEAYENRFWPHKFLIDRGGHVRYEHTGEGAYAETELMIQRLLRETDSSKTFPPPMLPVRDIDRPGVVCYPITPELYLGQTRGRLGNVADVKTNGPVVYEMPEQPEEGRIYAAGEWENQSEYLRHTRDTEEMTDFVGLRYRAIEVNAVMQPEEIYWKQVFVKQDGEWLRKEITGDDVQFDEKGRSYVEVKAPRMYNLVANQPYGTHEMRLYVLGKGLSVYSFSFGTCEIPRDADRLQTGKERP
jgi:thiol-disulfide isomerase/thioredoxin